MTRFARKFYALVVQPLISYIGLERPFPAFIHRGVQTVLCSISLAKFIPRLNDEGFLSLLPAIGSWPGPLHFGGGTGKVLVDEKGSDSQRSAIDKIARGKLGGKPWPLFDRTFDKWLETSFVPFEWKFDGAKSQVVAGDQLRASLRSMRNPVTGKETIAKIVLPEGILTKEENVTTTEVFSVYTDGMKFAWPGRNAWYGTVEHGT
jgi:hypothetical protein